MIEWLQVITSANTLWEAQLHEFVLLAIVVVLRTGNCSYIITGNEVSFLSCTST